MESDAESYALD